jgi:hypothetical protein
MNDNWFVIQNFNRIGILWVAFTDITALPICEGKHGRLTPTKKINLINYTVGGIGRAPHWCLVIVWPVSKARKTWPPERLPELPSKIAALVLRTRLFCGRTFSATWQ